MMNQLPVRLECLPQESVVPIIGELANQPGAEVMRGASRRFEPALPSGSMSRAF